MSGGPNSASYNLAKRCACCLSCWMQTPTCSNPGYTAFHHGTAEPSTSSSTNSHIRDVLHLDPQECLAGVNYITMFNLCKAFYQMPLHLDDHWKATVLTHRGQEALSCTIMGQSHSIAFLQHVLTTAFKAVGLSDVAFVYVDNFGIWSGTLDEHEQHVHSVLHVIQDLGLTLAWDKAHVACKEVPLLSHLISSKGTQTMPTKCQAIQSIPYPSALTQLEHIVGFFSYYKNYVPCFSALISPLHVQQSLTKLKSILQDWALQFPNYTQLFLLYVNALQQHGFALALHQNRLGMDTDKDVHCLDAIHPDSADTTAKVPVWFDSCALKPAERSYWPTELKAMAAVWALFWVKCFLDASPSLHFLFTDHLAVTSIANTKPFSTAPTARNPHLVCFTLILAKFCPKLHILHCKGMYMAHVDVLSHIQMSEGASIMFHVQELKLNPGLLAELLQSQQTDLSLKRVHDKLENSTNRSHPFNNSVFSLNADNMLCKLEPNGVWQLCIGTMALSHVIGLTHTSHLGAKATFDCFRTIAYTPRLLHHIEDYVKCCS
ncbi:hypothetical protein NDA14_003867 [Ustilago hordei]|nr:hypothetical protein NDA14_003867 [Ustilago hordei]